MIRGTDCADVVSAKTSDMFSARYVCSLCDSKRDLIWTGYFAVIRNSEGVMPAVGTIRATSRNSAQRAQATWTSEGHRGM